MAWTQTDLDKIEAAIKDGVLSVKYSDKTVQYRTLSEMLMIRDLIKKELGLSTSASTRIYPTYSKGLNGR